MASHLQMMAAVRAVRAVRAARLVMIPASVLRAKVVVIMLVMPVAPVARAGLEGLAKGRAVVVPGRLYRAMTLLTRFLPDSWVVRLAGAVMGRHE